MPKPLTSEGFLKPYVIPQAWAQRVVAWQLTHGRNDLPWQGTRDPYPVWLSEIMLQQTQVVTVLDYFNRFLQRFPDVQALAQATLDEVLGLWSGLGYYSRARNLHACAQQVVSEWAGVFPRSAADLQTLPGIGPSTAAAIASICYGERVAILDGNVKRVLTRVLGFDADLSQPKHERMLWSLAQQVLDPLPTADLVQAMPRYTQGMMDLGATVCRLRNPSCAACPVADVCSARQKDRVADYPVKTRRIKRTSQSYWLLLAATPGGTVWLSARPTPGVWAGLYCAELFASHQALLQVLPAELQSQTQDLPPVLHKLTHRDLHLHPVWLPVSQVQTQSALISESTGKWFSNTQWPDLGLPAPLRVLLEQLTKS
jgi:A/G-specific adenine glycosylase